MKSQVSPPIANTGNKPFAIRHSPFFTHCLVITAYLLLTILMTWPAILYLTDGIPGDGFDGWQNYWNMWWVKRALLIEGTSPYFTYLLYPPTGASLLFHTLNIFNSFWTLPIQLNLGLAVAYHAVVLVSFTLAGYGGFLLSLDTLTRLNLPPTPGWRTAAFVGGLIFTMSPFHMAHLLGHMQVFSLIWPPFYVLWLLRTLEPSIKKGAGGEVKNIALCCLFLFLVTLVDWYQTLYLLIFTGLALLFTIYDLRFTKKIPISTPVRGAVQSLISKNYIRPLVIVAAIGLGFSLLVAPLLIPMLRAARSTPGLEQSITLSADLLAFVLPSEMHPLWGRWAKTIADNFTTTTSERLIFAGFTVLALAGFAIIRLWREPLVKFWTFSTAFFFVLTLGPYLHLGGQMITIGGWPVPLPYLLLYYTIPFIRLTRSLSRYDLMVMMGLGVLAAIALAYVMNYKLQIATKKISPLLTQPPNPSKGHLNHQHSTFNLQPRFWLPLLAALLICFEFLPAPYPVSLIDTPQFYDDLAAEPGDFTIAELPMNWDRPTPMLYQTVHGQRLLTAYTSRDNPLELAWRTPVLQHWRFLGPDIIDLPLADIAPTIFYDFNLRYLVLDYYQMPPGSEREATERWVVAALPGAWPIYDDGRLKVYQTPPKQETRPYLTLGDGWSKRLDSPVGLVSRTLTADQPAELFLHHPPPHPLTFEITAIMPTTATLTLSALEETAQERQLAQFKMGPALSTQTVKLPLFTAGLVKLKLTASAGEVTVSRVSLQK
jgi:hypothetical protein